MSNEDEIQEAMTFLEGILARRLKYSRSWNQVETEWKKSVFRIKWCDPKKPDPEGKETSCVLERPMNLKVLNEEIDRQADKWYYERHDVKLG